MGVRALSRIQVLIEAGSVKAGQTEGILRKMRRHPVQNHADSLLMHIVHKIHEVLRCTVARRGCVVSGHLITPGFIQRMLHDRQQLHMGIAHLFYIRSKHRSQLPIGIKLPAVLAVCLRPSPASEMHLIDQQGLLFIICCSSSRQPFFIGPGKIRQVGNDRSGIRPKLCGICVRIRLQHRQPLFGLDLVFVAGACCHTRNKKLVDSGFLSFDHGMTTAVPQVEISHHADARSIRCPDGKIGSFDPVQHHRMGTQFFIDCIMNAFSIFFQIFFCENTRRKAIAVFRLLHGPVVIGDTEIIGRKLSSRNQGCEKACFIHLLHFRCFSGLS